MNIRFAEPCREDPLVFLEAENKVSVRAIDRIACHECEQDIYLGFFFDGTNNNKFRDTPSFSHSNVARLYEAFIGTQAGQTGPKAELTDAYGQKQKREIVPDQSFHPKRFPENEFPFYRKVYIPGVGTPFPDAKGGDRRTFVAGETLPTILVPAPRSLIQKLKGDPQDQLVTTAWTLVGYTDSTERA